MEYKEIAKLEEFVTEVEAALLSKERTCQVSYPAQSTYPWNEDQLLVANENLLSKASGFANVYTIFTAPKGSDSYSLKYIGKTKRKLARERIKNHLIKKNESTGAKLQNVVSHILGGGSVKISWVSVQPESLRNYIEEELISRHKEADRNRENA